MLCYKLNQFELDILKSNQNKIFGNEAETERTEIHVMKVSEAIEHKYVDWSNLGAILSVVTKNTL